MIFMIEAEALLLIGSVQCMYPDHLDRLCLRSWASFDLHARNECKKNSLGGSGCMPLVQNFDSAMKMT